MNAKSFGYAVIGAPVVAARKIGDRVSSLKGTLDKQAGGYARKAEARIEAWAAEGEKVVGKISDRKVVEEISAKVDLDQAREQVSKLRDQLEDMLVTWRTSFRPEKTEPAHPVTDEPAAKPAVKPAAKTAGKAPAKKPASLAAKPAAKTSAARTTKSAPKASTKKTETASAVKAS